MHHLFYGGNRGVKLILYHILDHSLVYWKTPRVGDITQREVIHGTKCKLIELGELRLNLNEFLAYFRKLNTGLSTRQARGTPRKNSEAYVVNISKFDWLDIESKWTD